MCTGNVRRQNTILLVCPVCFLSSPASVFHLILFPPPCQLYEEYAFSWEKIERGVQRILWGYFKKMVLADNAGIFVDAISGDLQTYKGLAIAGVLAYTVQFL